MSLLRIYLFGGLTIFWDERPLPPIPSTTARSLLAYLVTYRDRSHTRDLLAGTFWPDLPDAVARRRLSRALWQIRRTLAPVRDTLDVDVLLTEGDAVQLNPHLPLQLDVDDFVAKAQSPTPNPQNGKLEVGDWASKFGHLRDAVALYRGEFLSGYYDDWLLTERERLREMFLAVLERLVEGYKSRGEYEHALAHARHLAGEAPWREEAHREVMRLCHLLGRDNEALKHFETCRQILAEELDAAPSSETAALAREIAGGSDQGLVLDLPEAPPPPAVIVLDGTGALELPLVGRERERADLLAHVEALLQDLGGIVLVEGEAGVGKTRLLQTVARDAEWRGVEVLWGEAQEIEPSAPYGPLVEALAGGLSPLRASQLAQLVERIWLQALVPLLPSLTTWIPDLPPPTQLDPSQERDRLVAALGHLLAGWGRIKPLLMVLENLHWIGGDALDVLARLASSLGERGVLVVGSYRGEDARALPGVWRKIQALDRVGVRHRLVLSGLDASATGELIRRSLGAGSSAPLFEARLYQETRGNPLFVLETLRALHGEGLLTRDSSGLWTTPWDETTSDYAELPLPRAVEQTIARRLAGLSPSLQQTIQLAAILGERFDFDLLRAASQEESHVLLAAVRELVQRRFLDETDRDYRFSHDKVRQVAYDGIDAGERAQLHRQVAHALEILHPDRVTALAHHWTGAAAWDKAAHYYQQAGDRARAVYANAEAVSHYTQALAALERLPGPADPLRSFELHLTREAVYRLQGNRAAQAQDLVALAALAGQLDGPSMARLSSPKSGSGQARRRAEVALRQALYAEATGDYPQAVAAAAAAVAAAQDAQDAAAEANGYLQWGTVLWRQGEYDAARRQGEQALHLSRAAGLHRLEASSLRLLGSISRYQNDPTQARIYHEQALRVYRQIGDRPGESVTLNSLGVCFAWQSDASSARNYYEQALRVFREMGDRQSEGLQLNDLGLLYDQQGDVAQARDYLQQALRITREVNDRRGESQALNSLGTVSAKLGDYTQAGDCLQRALHITRELGDRFEESVTLYRIGDLCRRQGSYERALACFQQALAIKCELGHRQGERWDLSELCRISYRLGQDDAAREYGRQALQIAQELDDRHGCTYALFLSGQDLINQGRLTEAAQAYEQAIASYREQGRRVAAVESLAGLARVCLAQGELAQAQAHVEEILSFLGNPLTGHALAGFGEPFQVPLTCYRVLRANRDPRARDVLETAYRLVQERAAGIQDEELRRSFLKNVSAHREIVAAYRELQAAPLGHRVQVHLPRADAPTGRALRDDEYTTIAWTVDAPGDDAIPGKAARRRHRILRLLAEATAQAAVPRDRDLAVALGVSLATLRRDMTALRAQGHDDLPTRGRKMST